MDKIDFIVTWVNANDLEWRNEKEKWEKKLEINNKLNGEERYRDWDFMRYWFRTVEKYAPWVNKIFFVTQGHLPNWLNISNSKLEIVKHSDYISDEYLPTFNSNVIELNFHNIEKLSENFVLFNDDTLLNDFTEPIDFFENGNPKDTGIFSPIIPVEGVSSIVFNNLTIINKYFNSREVFKKNYRKYFNFSYKQHMLKNFCVLPWKNILGFYDIHIPVSHKKSQFKMIYEKESIFFKNTFSNKFRKTNEINHWLIRYWNLCEGEFEVRKLSFGKNYAITDNLQPIKNEIMNSTHKVIGLNDGGELKNFQETKNEILRLLERKYPEKSTFENDDLKGE